jgi:hypothetical protein
MCRWRPRRVTLGLDSQLRFVPEVMDTSSTKHRCGLIRRFFTPHFRECPFRAVGREPRLQLAMCLYTPIVGQRFGPLSHTQGTLCFPFDPTCLQQMQFLDVSRVTPKTDSDAVCKRQVARMAPCDLHQPLC